MQPYIGMAETAQARKAEVMANICKRITIDQGETVVGARTCSDDVAKIEKDQ